MPFIGALETDYVKGVALTQTERVKVFGITGVDGVGVHLLGKFGDPSSFTAIHIKSVAALNTWFIALSLLKGQIVTIINDEGQVYPNQLIEAVTQPAKATAQDGTGSEERWTVQVTARTV